ncbi:MAG: gamma-glutamylcyclotransferase family protein [Pseudanabaena sp.]|jgi:gamma-glutamylcyclotransferase (GGCT)/AIG2-like uncharacterized protein YtfP
MRKNYILSGTALAVILAVVALLRDIFDFKLTATEILKWVQNPFAYWTFTFLLFLIGILIGFQFSSKIRNSEKIRVFDLSNINDTQLFYEELYKSYREAQSEIYLTGTGFVTWSDTQSKLIKGTLDATERALKNKVSFVRIQMSSHPAEEWAEEFAKLMQDHPNRLKVFADYESTELANIALIDPNGRFPIVQILFETEEVGLETRKFDASIALSIYGRPDLAKSLQKRFLSRIGKLQRLLPSEMRELGLGIYYFAYGSNMSSSQMFKRCPTARKIGVGVLYGWELDFAVDAPHLGGNAAGIYRSSNKYVWGVVYAISKKDKEELDKTEQGGYYPVEVSIKMQDSQQHLNKVCVYIPAKSKSTANTKPDPRYVEIALKGAQENGIKELIDTLEKVRQSI